MRFNIRTQDLEAIPDQYRMRWLRKTIKLRNTLNTAFQNTDVRIKGALRGQVAMFNSPEVETIVSVWIIWHGPGGAKANHGTSVRLQPDLGLCNQVEDALNLLVSRLVIRNFDV